MALAYPGGAQRSRPTSEATVAIADERPLADFLPPAASALGVCQDLSKRSGGLSGYEFRLGSTAYPHLKLRIQHIELHGQYVWVYSVDTHDAFHAAAQFLSTEEAEASRKLVENNRRLKHEIETALGDAAGFITPMGLLRIDLTGAATI